MMRLTCAMVAGAMLAACGPTEPIFQRANTTPEQVRADTAWCKTAPTPVFTMGNPLVMCMKAKGYDALFGA